MEFIAKQQTATCDFQNTKLTGDNSLYNRKKLKCFHKYYIKMYATSLTCIEEDIEGYVEEIEYPEISRENAKFREEEVREAISLLPRVNPQDQMGYLFKCTVDMYCRSDSPNIN